MSLAAIVFSAALQEIAFDKLTDQSRSSTVATHLGVDVAEVERARFDFRRFTAEVDEANTRRRDAGGG